MIKLNNLLNEETFTATNKKTGKTSVFSSKDSRDSAIKAGTHSKSNDNGGDTSKKTSTPTTNIFNTPATTPSSTSKSNSKSISQNDITDNLGDSVEFGTYLDDNKDVFSKDDFNNLKSLTSRMQQLEEDLVDADMDDDDDLVGKIENKISNIQGEIENVLGKYVDNSNNPQTSAPKNKRGSGNPSVNKAAKKLADTAGFTPQKLGKEKYKEVMLQSAVKALKFKYPREARELVAALEGKPEFVKRIDYPSEYLPGYKEKMADINKNSAESSVYYNSSDEVDRYVMDVMKSGGDGWAGRAEDGVDAIADTLRTNGFEKEADLVQSVLNPNNKAKKNESKIQSIKLKRIVESITEAETFTATNKKTGKTSVFKSKDSRDSAIKAGTHSKADSKGDGVSKKTSKPTTNIFNTPTEEPKADTPTSEPKKKRPGNPSVNKDAKKLAEKSGITPQKLGNEKYKEAMFQAAVSALTDSNFHSEARELVAAIEGKPEFAKKPEYPSIKDPKYKEKMADIRKNSADGSIYMNGTGEIDDYGTDVSQASGWDGVDAADGIAFTLRMNGFHKEADLIQSVFDNKPYMKNEGRISLTKMVKEGDSKHLDTGLSNTEDSEAEQDFNQHHASSMYGKEMGTPAEKDTIDFDDNEPNEPGVQDSDAKKKDKVDRGYEPVKSESIKLAKLVK